MTTKQADRQSLSKRQVYEGCVLASFAIAIFQGALQMAPSLEVNGWAIALTKLIASPILSLAVAFAVSRLKSRIAALFFLAFMAVALWLIYLDLVEGYWDNIPFAVGIFSVIADLIACGLIVRWFVRREL